jgi:hypothetical protein
VNSQISEDIIFRLLVYLAYMSAFQILRFVGIQLSTRFCRVGSHCVIDVLFELFVQYFNVIYILGTKEIGWEFFGITLMSAAWKLVRLCPIPVSTREDTEISQKTYTFNKVMYLLFRERPVLRCVEKLVSIQLSNLLAYSVLVVITLVDYYQPGSDWLFGTKKSILVLVNVMMICFIAGMVDALAALIAYYNLCTRKSEVAIHERIHLTVKRLAEHWVLTFLSASFVIVCCIVNMVLPDFVTD